jgi:hypothetical protein
MHMKRDRRDCPQDAWIVRCICLSISSVQYCDPVVANVQLVHMSSVHKQGKTLAGLAQMGLLRSHIHCRPR